MASVGPCERCGERCSGWFGVVLVGPALPWMAQRCSGWSSVVLVGRIGCVLGAAWLSKVALGCLWHRWALESVAGSATLGGPALPWSAQRCPGRLSVVLVGCSGRFLGAAWLSKAVLGCLRYRRALVGVAGSAALVGPALPWSAQRCPGWSSVALVGPALPWSGVAGASWVLLGCRKQRLAVYGIGGPLWASRGALPWMAQCYLGWSSVALGGPALFWSGVLGASWVLLGCRK